MALSIVPAVPQANTNGPQYVENAILGRPRLGRYSLHRPALVERLDGAMTAHIVIVGGPAGAGKTALVADWAERVSREGTRRGIWVDVERQPNARDLLWQDVVTRASRLAGTPSGTVVDLEADELVRAIPRLLDDAHAVIVVDNLDRITDARVADDIRWLLRRCPGITFVLISRSRSALEYPGKNDDLDIESFDTAAHPLSEQEVAAALTLRGIAFDTAALRHITRELAGSPSAIFRTVTELASERRNVWHEYDVRPVVARLQDAIGAELTAALRTSDQWNALRATAALPWVSEEMSGVVLGEAGGAEVLRVAEHAGLGSWSRAEGVDRFTLSDIARLALTRDIETETDNAFLQDTRKRAARYFADRNQPIEALRLAHAAKDWPFVTQILLESFAELCRDHSIELSRLIDDIEPAYREQDPWLLLFRGSLAAALDGPSSSVPATLFRNADGAARDALRDAVGQQAVIATTLHTVTLRRTGNYGRAATSARKLIEQLDDLEATAELTPPWLIADARTQAGVTLLHDGSFIEAIRQFDSAERNPHAKPHVRIEALGYAALLRAIRGEIHDAERTVKRVASAPFWHVWRHSVWALPAQLADALIAVERNEGARARRILNVVEHIGLEGEIWPLIAYVQGVVSVVDGRGHAGFSAIRDFEARFGSDQISNHMLRLLFIVKCDLLLLSKQARPALAALRPFLDGQDAVVAAQARALLFSGNSMRARLFAERIAWHERLSPRIQMELAVVTAIAAGRHDDVETARAALDRAGTIAAQYGLRLPWSLVPHDELRDLTAAHAPQLLQTVSAAPPIFTSRLTVPTLTRRESIVLAHLRGPGAVEDIARDLMVSPNTVKTQLRSVYRKLGVRTRTDAVRVAYEWRLIGAAGAPESNEPQFSA